MVAAKAKALGLDTLAQSVSIGYVIVFLIGLGLVLWLNKTNRARLLGAGMVLIVFTLLPYMLLTYQSPAETIALAKQDAAKYEWKTKYNAAKPIFEKLCAEQSQPMIKRTVEDVEGVLLLKVRPSIAGQHHQVWSDPNWPAAAAPGNQEDTGDAEYYLLDRDWRSSEAKNKGQAPTVLNTVGRQGIRGFRYIDVLSGDGKTRTRITATEDTSVKEPPRTGVAFTRTATQQSPPRYAVTYEDNVAPELRKHWIAGTTIKVVDTKANEVIAQQSYWAWDHQYGVGRNGRTAWVSSISRCPELGMGGQPYDFIGNILKAKQGN